MRVRTKAKAPIAKREKSLRRMAIDVLKGISKDIGISIVIGILFFYSFDQLLGSVFTNGEFKLSAGFSKFGVPQPLIRYVVSGIAAAIATGLVYIAIASSKFVRFIPELAELRGKQGNLGTQAFGRLLDFKVEELMGMLERLNSSEPVPLDLKRLSSFSSACFEEAKKYGGVEPHVPSKFNHIYTKADPGIPYLKMQEKMLKSRTHWIRHWKRRSAYSHLMKDLNPRSADEKLNEKYKELLASSRIFTVREKDLSEDLESNYKDFVRVVKWHEDHHVPLLQIDPLHSHIYKKKFGLTYGDLGLWHNKYSLQYDVKYTVQYDDSQESALVFSRKGTEIYDRCHQYFDSLIASDDIKLVQVQDKTLRLRPLAQDENISCSIPNNRSKIDDIRSVLGAIWKGKGTRRVLDPAAGRGDLAVLLAKQKSRYKVSANETEDCHCLDIAFQRAKNSDVVDQLNWSQYDWKSIATDFGMEPDSRNHQFDAVLMVGDHVERHLTDGDDMERDLRQFYRLLKPEGILVIHKSYLLMDQEPIQPFQKEPIQTFQKEPQNKLKTSTIASAGFERGSENPSTKKANVVIYKKSEAKT